MAFPKAAKIGAGIAACLLVAGGILWTVIGRPKPIPETAEVTTTAVTTTTAETTAETTTTVLETAPPMQSFQVGENAAEPYITAAKAAELHGKAEVMAEYYRDFVGWIYIPNSRIDYPVMRGDYNDYYLHRNFNRQYEFKGSIFMDYRSPGDLSNETNIIYGHNMNAGTMFADIRNFRTNASFNAHRYGWIFTKDVVYRLDFIALSVLSAYDEMYALAYFELPTQEFFLERALATAQFKRDVEVNPGDKLVMLSTCAYDFEMARQIMTAKLVPLTNEADYVR